MLCIATTFREWLFLLPLPAFFDFCMTVQMQQRRACFQKGIGMKETSILELEWGAHFVQWETDTNPTNTLFHLMHIFLWLFFYMFCGILKCVGCYSYNPILYSHHQSSSSTGNDYHKTVGEGVGISSATHYPLPRFNPILQVHVGRNEAVAGQSRIIDTTMAYPWVNLRKPLQLSPALLLNAVFTIFMWLHL